MQFALLFLQFITEFSVIAEAFLASVATPAITFTVLRYTRTQQTRRFLSPPSYILFDYCTTFDFSQVEGDGRCSAELQFFEIPSISNLTTRGFEVGPAPLLGFSSLPTDHYIPFESSVPVPAKNTNVTSRRHRNPLVAPAGKADACQIDNASMSSLDSGLQALSVLTVASTVLPATSNTENGRLSSPSFSEKRVDTPVSSPVIRHALHSFILVVPTILAAFFQWLRDSNSVLEFIVLVSVAVTAAYEWVHGKIVSVKANGDVLEIKTPAIVSIVEDRHAGEGALVTPAAEEMCTKVKTPDLPEPEVDVKTVPVTFPAPVVQVKGQKKKKKNQVKNIVVGDVGATNDNTVKESLIVIVTPTIETTSLKRIVEIVSTTEEATVALSARPISDDGQGALECLTDRATSSASGKNALVSDSAKEATSSSIPNSSSKKPLDSPRNKLVVAGSLLDIGRTEESPAGQNSTSPKLQLNDCLNRSSGYPKNQKAAQTESTTSQPSSTTSTPDLDWRDDRKAIRGLINPRNFCYQNTVMQCMAAVIPFANIIINEHRTQRLRHSPSLAATGAFVALLEDMRSARSSNPLSLDRFRDAWIPSNAPEFGDPAVQQDVQEFFNAFLSIIHNELKLHPRHTINSKHIDYESAPTGISTAEAWRIERASDGSSVVSDTFDGLFRNRIKCSQCGTTSTKYEGFRLLTLSIPVGVKEPSLHDCLIDNFSEQTLDDWSCPSGCSIGRKISLKATKQVTLARLPPVLVVNLLRYTYNPKNWRATKNQRPVSYPVGNMDLSTYMTENVQGGGHGDSATANGSMRDDQKKPDVAVALGKYDLFAVGCHKGQSVDSGHYTSYVKSNSRWSLANDRSITPVGEQKVVDKDACLLFYRQA